MDCIQSENGLDFECRAQLSVLPGAPGAYRPGNGISWGLCQRHDRDPTRFYLQRLECQLNGKIVPGKKTIKLDSFPDYSYTLMKETVKMILLSKLVFCDEN